MGNIEKKEITSELSESYLDYAMSVIVSRALPDVRDGLKPVQRRILWGMWDSGLTSTAKFRKSANVVGEVMGRYHPHGDSAIYDAMVRMTQEFSLRYPLIHGQGNFGCFTKDTEVMLTDGRKATFETLVREAKAGKKNYTYTVNHNGLIAIAEIKQPRLTIKNAALVKVVLDNGAEIRCTPNHRFMLRGGSYEEAGRLKVGAPLMPLYTRLSQKTDRLNRAGYLLAYQSKKAEWVPVHRLADDYNLAHGAYIQSAGRVRHHADFNKLNNNPDNIVRLHWGEHWKIHYTHASEQHRNPEYRAKIAAGRAAFWADEANKQVAREHLSRRNLTNWQNENYRKHMQASLRETSKRYIAEHPEKRAELSQRAARTLKRLWQDPEYRAWMHRKIVKGNKNHTHNATGKVKFIAVCEEALRSNGMLTAESYERARKEIYEYGAAPLWKTGLGKYFQNNPELVLQALHNNHKVVRVARIRKREDVYDLTVDGTHNFALGAGIFVHNSIDGDAAAAMRYTEAKLDKIADELLTDIDKETVDWQPNYDGMRLEPKVVPARLPNLLLNGTLGIAVGMATSIPPHNLGEIVDAILQLADNPKTTSEDLLAHIKGPDFPTGGIIFDKKAIKEAYITGKGAVTVRAKTEIAEERKKGQFDIVITEIPYQVNKAELIKQMAELVTDKRIEGIRDIRDESDREGLRIVVELKNDAAPQKVLNQLFKHTNLQKDFHFNMIALVNGIEPRLLSLKEILAAYLEWRKIIVRRRAEFDLARAKERAHILEGLAKALSQIDKVIATIKKSEDRDDARANLMKQFKFSEPQANAILEMRLQTLANLEREKIDSELKEKQALIQDLETLLKSPAKILKQIKDELAELKSKYGDDRRTQVVPTAIGEFREEDLVPEESALITLSAGGYVKRMPPDAFSAQHRGGKGLIGSAIGEEDFISQSLKASTHDDILFFTDRGRVFQTKVYEIPAASRTAKGRAIQNFLELPAGENVSAFVSYSAKEASASAKASADKKSGGMYLVMVTKKGVIKKTEISQFLNIRRTGIIAVTLQRGDLLQWVLASHGKDEMILTTEAGQSIRFKESQVRSMGRTAAGIRAIKLKSGDSVAGFDILRESEKAENKEARLLVVMGNGFGKQTSLKEYKVQNRGGSGIKTANITAKTGKLISARVITSETELFALSAKGQIIRTDLKSVRMTGRAAQGVRIMNLNAGDKLATIVIL